MPICHIGTIAIITTTGTIAFVTGGDGCLGRRTSKRELLIRSSVRRTKRARSKRKEATSFGGLFRYQLACHQ
jgi:predicted amino acid dehydrogenase